MTIPDKKKNNLYPNVFHGKKRQLKVKKNAINGREILSKMTKYRT